MILSRVERADRQIEAGESLSESDGARNPHRDRERSPAFFFSPQALASARQRFVRCARCAEGL